MQAHFKLPHAHVSSLMVDNSTSDAGVGYVRVICSLVALGCVPLVTREERVISEGSGSTRPMIVWRTVWSRQQ